MSDGGMRAFVAEVNLIELMGRNEWPFYDTAILINDEDNDECFFIYFFGLGMMYTFGATT